MLSTPIIKDLDYDKVYEPSEDLYLLLDCFEGEKDYLTRRFGVDLAIVAEIGTGSGIVTTFLCQHILPKAIFLTTDINPHACKTVLKTVKDNFTPGSRNLVDSFQMDLTMGIRSEEIDVLVFNPPYVPAEEVPVLPTTSEDPTWLDLALLGGEEGMIVTWKVLYNLDSILSTRGVAYILFCARNTPEKVAQDMEERGWNVDTVIVRKAGWEVLSVLRFTRKGEAKNT